MSDFLAIYLPLVVFFLGLGAIAHARLLERPAYRGWWGEYKVNLLLRVCLSAEYRVFTHALYPGRDEAKPTQVDHVVVSRYGLFVIENRCLKGSIVVDPTEPNTWVQTIGRRKNRVRSPLVQNYAAIKAVRQAIGGHASKISNYAVMSGSATFPQGWPPRVFGPWALLRKIQSKKTPILTGSQVASICRALERGRIREGYWAARKHSGRANALSRETPAKDG